MFIYSIIMFLTAALFLAFSIMIYKGKTDLIHDYHQTKVSDKTAYSKAFGKALFVFAVSPLLSGVFGLFAQSRAGGVVAVMILLVGLAIGIGLLVAVQRKYNKGIF